MANKSSTGPEPKSVPESAAASFSISGARRRTTDDDIFGSHVGSSIGDAEATGRLASTYYPGENVKISGEIFRCRRFQRDYLGCNRYVDNLIGKVGTVDRVDAAGDIHVNFWINEKRCLCFEPVYTSGGALLRTINDSIGSYFVHMRRCSVGEAATTGRVATAYSPGEKVKISGEMFRCGSSQVTYRGYSDDVGARKVGTVVEVDSKGDVHVSFRSGEKLISRSQGFALLDISAETRLRMKDDDPAENFFRLFLASLEEDPEATRMLGRPSVGIDYLDNLLCEGKVFPRFRPGFLDSDPTRKKILNKESCVVDVWNKYGETALLRAAHEDFWGIVESLLFAGANINKADRDGNTALHICLMKMHEHPIKRVDMPTSLAMKAVEKNIREHHEDEVSEILLVACFLALFGADIRSRNREGKTPLEIALSLREPAVELLGFSAVESCFADNGKCRCCHEAVANTSFTPCPRCRCLYCRDCSHRMIRCLGCREFIEKFSNYHSATLKPKDEKKKVTQATKPMRGPQIYKMEKKPRGMCIIINNIDFQDQSKQRDGSNCDVQNMEFLFTALHFNVTVKKNLDAGDMLLEFVLASYAEQQQHADCLVVILMSCGGEEFICGVDGKKLKLHSQVYSLFNDSNCPGLKEKPKLFFVQSCRCSDSGDGTEDVPGPSNTYPTAGECSAATFSQPYNLMPFCSDMYIAHATIPGYVALKNETIGSWFLSAVSEVFSEHSCKMPFDGLMAQVIERCSRNGSQQTPRVIKARWQKQLYFNPGI